MCLARWLDYHLVPSPALCHEIHESMLEFSSCLCFLLIFLKSIVEYVLCMIMYKYFHVYPIEIPFKHAL